MDVATESRSRRARSVFLAGLQAGMIGALSLLAWMGITAILQARSFWTFENLAASAVYGSSAIHSGFASITAFGMAAALLLYSLLGAAFALIVPARTGRLWMPAAGILFALCWYYLTFRWLFTEIAPSIALLHVERTTLWGHAIYGLAVARFRAYMPAELIAQKQKRGDLPNPATCQDYSGDRRA